MKQSDNGAFEFGSSSSIDRGRTKRFPNNSFANIRGDKQRNTGTQTVTFLQKFVQQQDDQTSHDELKRINFFSNWLLTAEKLQYDEESYL